MPALAVSFSEVQRPLLDIDPETVTGKGIVRSLKENPRGCIKDYPPPSPVIIIELGRAGFAVHAEFLDVPDTVKGRLGTSAAIDEPESVTDTRVHNCEIETKRNLQT